MKGDLRVSKYIVQLESDSWLKESRNGLTRTLDENNATVHPTLDLANAALYRARKTNNFPDGQVQRIKNDTN